MCIAAAFMGGLLLVLWLVLERVTHQRYRFLGSSVLGYAFEFALLMALDRVMNVWSAPVSSKFEVPSSLAVRVWEAVPPAVRDAVSAPSVGVQTGNQGPFMRPKPEWGEVSPGWFLPAILSVPLTVASAVVAPQRMPWLWLPLFLGVGAALVYGAAQLQAVRLVPLPWTELEVWPPWSTRFRQYFDIGSPVSVVETTSTVSVWSRRAWWSCARCDMTATSAATWRDYVRLPWLERQLERHLEPGARVLVLVNEDDAVVFAHEPHRRGGTQGALWAMAVLWAKELFERRGDFELELDAADATVSSSGAVSTGRVEHAARAFKGPSLGERRAAFADLAREPSTPPAQPEGASLVTPPFSSTAVGSTAQWRPASESLASAAAGLLRIVAVVVAPIAVVVALMEGAARVNTGFPEGLAASATWVFLVAGVAFALVSLVRLLALFRRGAPIELSGTSLKRTGDQVGFTLERTALLERRWSLRALWWVAHAAEGTLATGERVSVRSVRESPWLSPSCTAVVIEVATPSPRGARVTERELQTMPRLRVPRHWDALAELQHFLFQEGGGTVLVLPEKIHVYLPWGGFPCHVAEAVRFALRFAKALQSLEGLEPRARGYRDGPAAPAPEELAWLNGIAEAALRGFPAPAGEPPPKDGA